jgi:methyltransferase (TIGR00027 family)
MHQFDPDRILQDDYVSWFIDEPTTANLGDVKAFIKEDSEDPARAFSRIAYRCTILRERHIDEIIEDSIESGCRQLLLLGSGYDTRFFRLPSIRKHSVATFEVDLAVTIKEKIAVLEKRLGSFRQALHSSLSTSMMRILAPSRVVGLIRQVLRFTSGKG